ncbi:MAG TPA: hypothetical protein VD833_14650 [Vicinamibacterales bacterium]|nr:hypothetical protein [Vicinamibacterales bacterium]
MPRLVPCAMVLTLSVAAAACDNGPELTTPTPPPTVTDTFTGNVNLNGAAVHPFSVSTAGTVTATLVSITPAENNVLGFSMGTWDGVTCRVVLANEFAAAASTLTGRTQSAASLCIRIYDQGNLKNDSVDYSVQVDHP